jgi:hypothetical protein
VAEGQDSESKLGGLICHPEGLGMVTSFADILSSSGDSRFDRFLFDGNVLKLWIRLGESGKEILFSIFTQGVVSDFQTNTNEIFKNCYLDFKPINQILRTVNNRYAPAERFEKVMEEVRMGAQLAYGKKANEKSGLFAVQGYTRLLVCYLERSDDVEITEI